jgi:hypothetical protein
MFDCKSSASYRLPFATTVPRFLAAVSPRFVPLKKQAPPPTRQARLFVCRVKLSRLCYMLGDIARSRGRICFRKLRPPVRLIFGVEVDQLPAESLQALGWALMLRWQAHFGGASFLFV